MTGLKNGYILFLKKEVKKDLFYPQYDGEYKVGIAKYVETRLNSYQTSDPDRSYKIEYKFETPFFREIEKFIHNKFENKHEWVKAELNEIIAEIKSYKE